MTRATAERRVLVVLRLLLIPALLAVVSPTIAHGAPACPPPQRSRADLDALKRGGFAVAAAEERNRLAVLLLSCFDDPDPAVRDGIVFEALSKWLRARELEPATIHTLAATLLPALRSADDARGFRKPFAALILSEVARADRITPMFSDSLRNAFVAGAAAYMRQITDYRGFDPKEGWRHGVAHTADLVLQLGLNAQIEAEGLQVLLDAVATQIAPKGAAFYTFGEPERLARAVFFIHRRGVVPDAWWDSWFTSAGSPTPLVAWSDAFSSLEGLARRHNVAAFMHAVAFAGRANTDEAAAKIVSLAHRETVRVTGG
ncbi:MAG: DUF2785 domain-containing protein [Gemmatimonadaceae bacterium]